MAKDPFLLVSLEESESKALAQVMSNDTARKILDYLSKHESATESKVATDLKIALSTVHYNLQALTKANLVQTEEFHYSEKGKEVLHYSLANKLIIIAPKRTSMQSMKDRLKGLLPAVFVSLGGAAMIQLYQMYFSASAAAADFAAMAPEAAPMMAKLAVEDGVENAAAGVASEVATDVAVGVASESLSLAAAPAADSFAMQAAPAVQAAGPDFTLALIFLAGSLVAILGVVAWDFFKSRRK
jgi:DNA-binding transcriptional ArsR family regulator